MIRQATKEDIYDATSLYMNYMFDSVFSKLDRDFIYIMFEGILSSRYGISFVYEEDSRIAGFIVASTDTQRLFNEILRKQMFSLLRIILFSLLRKPRLLLQIPGSFLYFKKAKLKDINAELLFITIDPCYRNRGISKELIATTLIQLSSMAVSKAKVTTQKKNCIVNNLLKTMGFSLVNSFTFYGKENLLYKVTLGNYEKHC